MRREGGEDRERLKEGRKRVDKEGEGRNEGR